jgi:hypothetical protein
MRHDIAEAGEVDLVGLDHGAHGTFDRLHHREQMLALAGRQVGQFRDMRRPDDAAEAGKSSTFVTADADDAANLILPEEFSAA